MWGRHGERWVVDLEFSGRNPPLLHADEGKQMDLGIPRAPKCLILLISSYHESLKDAIELSFRCPKIQNLGPTARDTLEEIAAFPHGVEERRLESVFLSITGIGAAVDMLCKSSLIYRQDGFVKMLSTSRFYFLESAVVATQHVEVIRWDADCSHTQACTSISYEAFAVTG